MSNVAIASDSYLTKQSGQTLFGIRDATAGIVILNVAIGLVSIVYGFDYAFPAEWRGSIYRLSAAVFFGLLLSVMVLEGFSKDRTADAAGGHRLLCVLCLVQVSLTLFFNLPSRLAIVSIAALWLASWWAAMVRGWLAAVGLSVAVACALYVGSVVIVPSTTPGADMLPFIARAIDVFRGGANPYTADYRAINDNPFFYAPVQWLIYLPFQVAGLDLRVLNLSSAAVIIWIVERRAAAGRSIRIGVYPLLMSPLVLPMMYNGQVWPYWLSILVFACLILDRRWAWAAVAAALAISTRQTALVPVTAVMLAMAGRIRLSAWLICVGLAVITILAVFLPFVMAPGALDAQFVSGPAQALRQAHLQGNPGNQITISNILDWLGLARWDTRVEIGLVIATAFAARLGLRNGLGAMLAVAGIGYALTISANPYLHRYYYVAGLLLAGVGLAAGDGVDSQTPRVKSPARS